LQSIKNPILDPARSQITEMHAERTYDANALDPFLNDDLRYLIEEYSVALRYVVWEKNHDSGAAFSSMSQQNLGS